MKAISHIKIFIYGLILFTYSSCSVFEDFGDTNTDPSQITEGDAGALLASSLRSLGSTTSTSGIYIQYFMESQYPGTSYYQDNSSSFTGNYTGVLNRLQQAINLNASNNTTQVARIVQQYFYLRVTDQWGDVPYSEALLGEANSRPVYDTQETIYRGAISTLQEAISSFDGSAISGDIVYGGDVAAWKRLGNSIILLASIQLSKVYPSAGDFAATSFNAALSDAAGYITSNDQNFELIYPGDAYQNPWYAEYFSRQDLGESETMTDLMASLSDTRQNAFGGASTSAGSTTSSNIGIPYGITRNPDLIDFISANPTWARVLRGDLRDQTDPFVLISAAHVTLVRAEAANLGWTSENVSALYEQGIRLSFEYWGESVPTSYFSQADVAIGTDNTKKIAIQQFIAVYPNGLLGWNIWRKTGYPELTPTPSANTLNESGQIPRRLKYDETGEKTSNAVNLEAAIARLSGGNSDVARVWWDQE